MTSSPVSPRRTGFAAASTTASCHPCSGSPIRTGSPGTNGAPHATTVASVGP